VALDAAYALAYAGLADAYISLGNINVLRPRDAFPRARDMAARALALDDGLAEAHTSLGTVAYLYDWDWVVAEREFQEAIRLQPNYVNAHNWYAVFLAAMGRFPEAIAEIKRAQELEPLSLIVNANLGWIYALAGRYDEAIAQLRATLDLEPNFANARLKLGRVYELKGLYDQAIVEMKGARELSPDDSNALAALGHAYAVSGRKEEARRMIAALRRPVGEAYAEPFFVALIYVGLGEDEQAFAWMRKAYEERSNEMKSLKKEPRLDRLRSDPRFVDLSRQVGFAP
jgi:tetratricopeptide (TPR) repeat protein